MSFSLDKVVPWGRSLAEYGRMFALSDEDLAKKILGCGDGPASFNAELTAQGGKVVSIDPLYQFSPEAIDQRFEAAYTAVMSQMQANASEFVWDFIENVEQLGQMRRQAMELFIADLPKGLEDGRYLEGGVPELPFNNGAFDLALCSHFLFLYSGQFSLEFHIQSLVELCRVAKEVRVFPLLELGSIPSRHVDGITQYLAKNGYDYAIEEVPYEFQKGGNQMLRVQSG